MPPGLDARAQRQRLIHNVIYQSVLSLHISTTHEKNRDGDDTGGTASVEIPAELL